MRQHILLCIVFCVQGILGKKGFGPTNQEWGLSKVRPGAKLFWWLHYTTANVSQPTDRPLIIWLQGGPGCSSSGYGNFAEIGPWDNKLKPRKHTWVQWVNVLFVDNPVGTGLSFVSNNTLYARNNSQIATDFLKFLKNFYRKLPKFKTVPLYIFSESYGGKMAVEIALVLYQAIQKGEIKSNLKGVGLGAPWISPIDAILNYAPYLLNLGLIDVDGYHIIMEAAEATKYYIDTDNFESAFLMWNTIVNVVKEESDEVDFYNVFRYSPTVKLRGLSEDIDPKIAKLMNRKVARTLGIKSKFFELKNEVWSLLGNDFMKPVKHIVEALLNLTDITVAVYTGQLDLIVNTPGTLKWVEDISFKGKDEWKDAPRLIMSENNKRQGYYKRSGQFAFYWVNNAGHMVPGDNPSAMRFILRDVTNNFEVTEDNDLNN
ncbi:unnamed protein product [Diabrotica balteata]|uniref:Carboxypeptidase n=1 Tax=Diabrotica balteata TaxID=107213 RepID=A0A9N9T415_DIABA|nr:unnamed protein product [Diabrotica balteata]